VDLFPTLRARIRRTKKSLMESQPLNHLNPLVPARRSNNGRARHRLPKPHGPAEWAFQEARRGRLRPLEGGLPTSEPGKAASEPPAPRRRSKPHDRLAPDPHPCTAPTLTAQRLKVTLVLDADELAAIPVEDGRPRVSLRISLPDRIVAADIAVKSLRKAQATISDAGPEGVAPAARRPCRQQCCVGGQFIRTAQERAQARRRAPPRPTQGGRPIIGLPRAQAAAR
jgi:hypothetical protein